MRINEDYLYVIEKNGSYLRTNKYDIFKHLQIKKLIDNFCVDLDNKDLTTSNIKNKYYDLVRYLKNNDPSFFSNYDYVHNIYSSYEQFSLKDNNSLITEKRIKNGFIKDYLHELFLAYSHSQTRKKMNPSVLAYSHRRIGWHADDFRLDSNFMITISTNFGYGSASYFHLIMKYKNIKIIPYTKIIYYRYANASSILYCTESYSVMEESWGKCYEFVAEEVNRFNHNGRQSFIREHIIKSVEDLCDLIGKILSTDVFYFADINKLSSYLELNEKKIIYDYEHLLRNVNPHAINEKAIQEFVFQYNKLTKEGIFNPDVNKLLKEVSNPIFDSYAKDEIHQSDKNKERYGYAIAILLSKYYIKFDENGEISDDIYSEKIQSVVKRILDIELNYNILLYKYSGFNLIRFRNERMNLCFELFDSIKSLNEIIDSNGYIRKLKNNSNILLNQNIQFYNNLLPIWEIAKREYEKIKAKYEQEKEMFDNTIVAKKEIFFNELFTKIEKLTSLYEFNDENGSFAIKDGLEEKYNEFKEFIMKGKKELSINVSSIIHLNEYGNNSHSYSFSIGNLRRNLESATDDNKNKSLIILKNALEMNKTCEECFDYLIELHDKVDNSIIFDKISKYYSYKKMVDENGSFYIYPFGMTYYKECFVANCDIYINNKKEYDVLIKPLNELMKQMNESYNVYYGLNSQKESIEKWNKKIEEVIKND